MFIIIQHSLIRVTADEDQRIFFGLHRMKWHNIGKKKKGKQREISPMFQFGY